MSSTLKCRGDNGDSQLLHIGFFFFFVTSTFKYRGGNGDSQLPQFGLFRYLYQVPLNVGEVMKIIYLSSLHSYHRLGCFSSCAKYL